MIILVNGNTYLSPPPPRFLRSNGELSRVLMSWRTDVQMQWTGFWWARIEDKIYKISYFSWAGFWWVEDVQDVQIQWAGFWCAKIGSTRKQSRNIIFSPLSFRIRVWSISFWRYVNLGPPGLGPAGPIFHEWSISAFEFYSCHFLPLCIIKRNPKKYRFLVFDGASNSPSTSTGDV